MRLILICTLLLFAFVACTPHLIVRPDSGPPVPGLRTPYLRVAPPMDAPALWTVTPTP